MQSLKSTAFAVTLLAISFGLYCVTSTTAPEPEMLDPIEIDTSLSTSQKGSMALPSYDLSNPTAPMQISTNTNPGFSGNVPPLSTQSAPELPSLQAPNLNQSGGQFSSNPAPMNQNPPLKLPTLSQSTMQVPPLNNEIKLPEIAQRQPVSTMPAARDDGLINALQSNDQASAAGSTSRNDNSFNSLATAVTKDDDDNRVKSADGSLGSIDLAMPEFKPASPAKPAPFSIANVWTEVDQLVAADEYRKALGALSQHYGRKGLTGPQQQKLQGWLDALAGKVIYSTEHHFFREPYVVKRGETLESIGRQLKIPGEVIFNINRAQFAGSTEVSPGMELKVINGPFHAEVDMDTKMMTLFIKNLYAGRFPVAIGISGNPHEGNFNVMVKSPKGYTWRDANGKEYPAGAPGNGYGPYWIGLTDSLCIHAVPPGTPHGHHGCIGLSEKDAKDVFGILSKESQLSIIR